MDKPRDWHTAEIREAIKKRGLSLSRLSVANGYHPTAVGKALRRPWPRVEQIIAAALGETPQTIWPSRYDPEITSPETGPEHGFRACLGILRLLG
jgi:Ner family transcriptional regulator